MANGGSIEFEVKVTGYWQKCPVCEGRGIVHHGFYHPWPTFPSTSTCPEVCRRCDGDGTIRCPIRDEQ